MVTEGAQTVKRVAAALADSEAQNQALHAELQRCEQRVDLLQRQTQHASTKAAKAEGYILATTEATEKAVRQVVQDRLEVAELMKTHTQHSRHDQEDSKSVKDTGQLERRLREAENLLARAAAATRAQSPAPSRTNSRTSSEAVAVSHRRHAFRRNLSDQRWNHEDVAGIQGGSNRELQRNDTPDEVHASVAATVQGIAEMQRHYRSLPTAE